MSTTIDDRLDRSVRAESDRAPADGATVRERIPMRTIALLLLGAGAFVAFVAAAVTVWRSYRPYRGC